MVVAEAEVHRPVGVAVCLEVAASAVAATVEAGKEAAAKGAAAARAVVAKAAAEREAAAAARAAAERAKAARAAVKAAAAAARAETVVAAQRSRSSRHSPSCRGRTPPERYYAKAGSTNPARRKSLGMGRHSGRRQCQCRTGYCSLSQCS